jgi:hypothetical protein
MNELQAGDACEIIDSPEIVLRQYIGTACELISLARWDEKHDCSIRTHDGIVMGAALRVLRKKRPPTASKQQEEVGEWALCPWRPKRVSA